MLTTREAKIPKNEKQNVKIKIRIKNKKGGRETGKRPKEFVL
jgi:hypothetical protein